MYKRLYRSRTNQVIGGVCAGVAEYFDIDPVIVRIVTAVLALFSNGIFIIIYLLMWAFLPEAPEDLSSNSDPMPKEPIHHDISDEEKEPKTKKDWRDERDKANVTGGLVLIAIGGIFLLQNFGNSIDFGRLWPVILLAIGAGMLINAARR